MNQLKRVILVKPGLRLFTNTKVKYPQVWLVFLKNIVEESPTTQTIMENPLLDRKNRSEAQRADFRIQRLQKDALVPVIARQRSH